MSFLEKFEPLQQVKQAVENPIMNEVVDSAFRIPGLFQASGRHGQDDIRTINDHLSNRVIYPDTSHHGTDRGGRRPHGPDFDRDDRQQQYEDRVDDATKYLRENFRQLDRGGDGQVSRWEINRALDESRGGDAQRHLRTLSENYDEIKNSFQEGRETRGITRADARETNADLDRNREIRDLSDKLQGNPRLFNALDRAGKRDGKISEDDLNEFMRDSMKMLVRGKRDGIHTVDNMQFVAEMLTQWNDPNSAVYQMRDGDRMSHRSINRAREENQFGGQYSQPELTPWWNNRW